MQLIDAVAPLTLLTLIDSLAPLKLQTKSIFAQKYVTSYKEKNSVQLNFKGKTVADNCRKSMTKGLIGFR